MLVNNMCIEICEAFVIYNFENIYGYVRGLKVLWGGLKKQLKY